MYYHSYKNLPLAPCDTFLAPCDTFPAPYECTLSYLRKIKPTYPMWQFPGTNWHHTGTVSDIIDSWGQIYRQEQMCMQCSATVVELWQYTVTHISKKNLATVCISYRHNSGLGLCRVGPCFYDYYDVSKVATVLTVWNRIDSLQLSRQSATVFTVCSCLGSGQLSWQYIIFWIGHGLCHFGPYLL